MAEPLRYCLAAPDGFSVEQAQQFVIANFRTEGAEVGCGPGTMLDYVAHLLASRELEYVIAFDEAGIQAVTVCELRGDTLLSHLTAIGPKYEPLSIFHNLAVEMTRALPFERWSSVVPDTPASHAILALPILKDAHSREVNGGFIEIGGPRNDAAVFVEVPLA